MRPITNQDAAAIAAAQEQCPALYLETLHLIERRTLEALKAGKNDDADRLAEAMTLAAHFLPDHEPTEDRDRLARRAAHAAAKRAKSRHLEDQRRTVALDAATALDGFSTADHLERWTGTAAVGTNNPSPDRMTEPTALETIEAAARIIRQEHGPASEALFLDMAEAYRRAAPKTGKRPGLAAPLTTEEGHALDSTLAKTYRSHGRTMVETLAPYAADLLTDPNQVEPAARRTTPTTRTPLGIAHHRQEHAAQEQRQHAAQRPTWSRPGPAQDAHKTTWTPAAQKAAAAQVERPGAALGRGQESTPQASPIVIGHAPSTWTAHPAQHAWIEVRDAATGQTLYATHDLDRYDEIRASVLAHHTDAPAPWTPQPGPDAAAERRAAAPRKGKPNTSKPRKVRAAVTGATVTR